MVEKGTRGRIYHAIHRMTRKTTSNDKKNYVLHIKALKQAPNHGLIL